MSLSRATRHVNPWVVLALVCMAQFMVVLDATVVNVALPRIKDGLGFSQADLSWIVNAYTLTFGGFLLLGGRAGDLFGRQRIFLLGLAVFTGASIFNGFAQSPTMLIVGRAVQGLGGALISPAALSIITSTFEEGSDRNRALGVWSALAASGAAFGLIIGGALTQAISWRWAFFVNGPVGVVTFLLAARLVPDTKLHGQRGVDIAGAVTVTGGLMAIVYALVSVSHQDSQGNPAGWTAAPVLFWGAVGIALLVAFVVIQSRYRSPLVRLGIFESRSLSVANFAMFLVAGGMFAMFLFLTLYIQQVLGYSPLTAGFAFLPFCAGIGLGAGLASTFVKRVDARVITAAGTAIAAFGFLLLTRIAPDSGYAGVLLAPMLTMSVGMGLMFVPLTLIATTNVAKDDAGLASGLLNTSQQVGGSLGLAVLATLATARTTDFIHQHGPDVNAALIAGFQLAFVGSAIILLAAGVATVALIRRSDVAGIAEAAARGATVIVPVAATEPAA